MDIRLAQPDDLPAIVDLSNWAAANTAANFAVEPESLDMWRESFARTHERFPWLVAVEGAVLLGFAKATPWKGRCAYDYSAEVTVYVQPNRHGQGIGRALYSRLLGTMQAQGFHSVLGGITQPNEASVRLHESFGMKRVALLERIGWKFDKWHDVGYWQLQLCDPDAPPTPIRPVHELGGLPEYRPG
jgi:phosphinothricin acetyltransferase